MRAAKAGILAVLFLLIGAAAGHYFIPFALNTIASIDVFASRRPSGPGSQYSIKTTRKSYFALDGDGNLIAEQLRSGRYYKVGEGEYVFQRQLSSNKTALIVMDPWADSGSEDLNKYFAPVLQDKILPLVLKSIALGIPVFVLSNDPKTVATDYEGRIHPELALLAEKHGIQILYHQDFNDDSFAKYLKRRSIDTLIYSGFNSNMCVIGRSDGMIPMTAKGFRLFFVPGASAAVEFKDTWTSSNIHAAMTTMISQWVGELIDWDDFMRLVPAQH